MTEVSLNNIKRFDFTDILGWSVSRYDKFVMCKRQYYYDYYGKYDTEFPRSKINSLKQMTSVALETGNIVHDTVKVLLERLLKSDKPIDKQRFTEFVKRMTEDNCSLKTFAEVYYKDREKIDTASIYKAAWDCLNNFLTSDRFTWITKKALSNKTGWVIEPPGYGETRIDGMKAYCKVDFLFPVDKEIYILDWKTGKQDEKKHRKQLIGYSAWASYHFDKKPSDISPMVAYLNPKYSETPVAVSEKDITDFSSVVKKESEEMYAFCGNIEKNTPKPKSEFAQIPQGKVCGFCNYRELCGRQ